MLMWEFHHGDHFTAVDSQWEPGLSEYAVEAWERQNLPYRRNDYRVPGQGNEVFVVYVPDTLWYRWFDPYRKK